MRDLSMDALRKAAAAAQQKAERSEAPKKEDAKDPAPAKLERPLSDDLPPGSSAMLTDLADARAKRSSEEPDDAEQERHETAYELITSLRSHCVEVCVADGEVHYHPDHILSDLARSELERVKAEIIEILREEEEREARREAKLAAQPEMDPMTDEEYEELCNLLPPRDPSEETEEEYERRLNAHQDTLFHWIAESLEISPETGYRYRYDSYYLKHVFEGSPEGFYVTDGQFRAAMWLSGFLGRRYPGRHYEDCETRYYYVRPNRKGLVDKLTRQGVPSDWAWEAIIGSDEIKGKKL